MRIRPLHSLPALILLIHHATVAFVPSVTKQHRTVLHQTPPIDVFDLFCTMRTGVGHSDTVIWFGSGTIFEAYSGRTLANFEGFDVGKGIQLDSDTVRQLSRKLFWFRDAESGELLTEYNGCTVKPIRYDHQVFDYERGENGLIFPSVVSSERHVPILPITHQFVTPKVCLFQVPVFVDIETPVGRYQAWEFYDYNADPSFQRPTTVTWCRQASTPPFNTNGAAVMKFTGSRITSFQELPVHMRELVEESYPLFRAPPANMAEVEALQGVNNSQEPDY